jgi:hypothetical protein
LGPKGLKNDKSVAETSAIGMSFRNKVSEIVPETNGFFILFAARSSGSSITSLLHPTTSWPAKIAALIRSDSSKLNCMSAIMKEIDTTKTVGPKWAAINNDLIFDRREWLTYQS